MFPTALRPWRNAMSVVRAAPGAEKRAGGAERRSVEPEAFPDLLRRLRRAEGLTQEQLAERANVSARSVSNLERALGQRPHRETALMLAAGLDLAGPERAKFLEAARRRPDAGHAQDHGPLPPLPVPDRPLLGRERELREVVADISRRSTQFLTITGPGGVGKTRLAIAVAHEAAGAFADGALFLRLDGLSDPDLILPTLASALQVRQANDGASLAERLAERLAGMDVLVVLDNMEHLLPAVTDLPGLLQDAPGATLLATSREALRVRGERVRSLAPFPRPDLTIWRRPGAAAAATESPAIALFVQQARACGCEFPLHADSQNGLAALAAIAEICHRLDGLPLAIELAAAQSQTLSPAAILAMMNGAGLPLLTMGGRDQPPRLQTMEAAIAWSYALLPPPEQAVFRALSVFAGGFTLPAAAAVAGAADAGAADPLTWHGSALAGMIAALAGKHLLVEDVAPSGDAAPRFRMLEPIRLFGIDRLREAGEEYATRMRHAAYFAALAETLDALALGRNAEVWFAHLTADLDNFRAAQDWALSAGEHELTINGVCGIAQLWATKGFVSASRRCVAAALTVDAAATTATRWFLRYWVGIFALNRGDPEAAIDNARELLAIAEAHDDAVGVGVGLAQLSRAIGAYPDRHQEAADLARRAVETLEPLGHDSWTATAWSRLGAEHHWLGELEKARHCFTRSLERRRGRCAFCAAYALVSLGLVLSDLGQPRAALAAYGESVAAAITSDDTTPLLAALLGLADLAWRFGEAPDRERHAPLLFGAADVLLRRHGYGQVQSAQEAIARWQAPLRQVLGDEMTEALIGEGRELPTVAIVALVHGLRMIERSQTEPLPAETPLLLGVLGSID